jgi:excisionase family DNA binding protein
MADDTTKNASDEGTASRMDMDPIPVISETDLNAHVGFADAEEFENQGLLEHHDRSHRHDTAHVNLSQEEYTPEEVARMIGTSLDVVMHAIWHNELKADRKGHNVICIKHEDVTSWLKRRAAE